MEPKERPQSIQKSSFGKGRENDGNRATSQRIVKGRLAESVAVKENIMKLNKVVKDKRRAKMKPKVNKSEAKVIKKKAKREQRAIGESENTFGSFAGASRNRLL